MSNHFQVIYVDSIFAYCKGWDLAELSTRIQKDYSNTEHITPEFLRREAELVCCAQCGDSYDLYIMDIEFECTFCQEKDVEIFYKKMFPRWRWNG